MRNMSERQTKMRSCKRYVDLHCRGNTQKNGAKVHLTDKIAKTNYTNQLKGLVWFGL